MGAVDSYTRQAAAAQLEGDQEQRREGPRGGYVFRRLLVCLPDARWLQPLGRSECFLVPEWSDTRGHAREGGRLSARLSLSAAAKIS